MKKDADKTKAELIEEMVALRKSAEEERFKAQKLESISEIAGGVAHDFNNQLMGVLGYVSVAKGLVSPDEQIHPLLEKIEKAALRTRAITRQFLTFSEGGKTMREPTDIRGMIEESAAAVLRDSDVRCSLSLDEDLWSVLADETELPQVFVNIILNARQAMENSGEIDISAVNATLADSEAPGLEAGEYVLVTIRDHGPGVDPETLSEIFKPFFTTKQKASGLGLAVSWSIVKKHRGVIEAGACADGGLEVRVWLPSASNSDMSDKDGKEKVMEGNGRILVMDDEEVIRDVTGEMLKMLGYESEFALDGEEAVKKYRDAMNEGARFDAVILDLSIPNGMGGREVIGRLIETDPEVKAIVSSGYSRDPIMTEFREHGFCAVIAKPYRVAEFGKVINEVLSRG